MKQPLKAVADIVTTCAVSFLPSDLKTRHRANLIETSRRVRHSKKMPDALHELFHKDQDFQALIFYRNTEAALINAI